MNEVHVYVTRDGRSIPIPADIYAQTKFTKSGTPDLRSKANTVFNAWADEMEASGDKSKALMAAAAVVALPALKAEIEADVMAMAAQSAQAYANRNQHEIHRMNEPKRRGRPPKAIPEWPEAVDKEVAASLGVPVDAAQAYANRIWAKQSVSLSRHERLGRIAAALQAQGLSMEGVELP